jgi:membrane protease YdiL (CAAX protease family)
VNENKRRIYMKSNQLSAMEWRERILLALLFTAVGGLIIIVFSPWRPLLEPGPDYLGRLGLILFLLLATVLARKNQRFEKYGQVLFGLLVMAVAVTLDRILSIYLMVFLGENGDTPLSFTLLKLNECAVIVFAVIFFTRISGGSLGSIYVQKGNLKLSLTIGLIAFFISVAGSIPMASLMFKAGDMSLTRVMSWIPWLLLSALANGALEEFLFRGLFLRKLEPFFGRFLSVLLIAFVFTILHKTVGYSLNEYGFLVVVFPLALAWGYITQKTDSLWGTILFHAGTDIPVFLSIFSNY